MNELIKNQRMTSIEIAEVTGKQHKDVMKAIRKMEPAWEKTCGRNFALTSRSIVQPNGGTREIPCYSLTKTECLYVATKFNDEARAKLVLRWEELERERLVRTSMECRGGYELSLHDFKLLSAKAEYVDEVLQSMDCMTTTQVAKEMSMTGPDLYRLLLGLGVCYWQSGQYMLYAQYAREQLARTRTHTRRLPSGRVRTEVYLVWTQKGREFLHGLVK